MSIDLTGLTAPMQASVARQIGAAISGRFPGIGKSANNLRTKWPFPKKPSQGTLWLLLNNPLVAISADENLFLSLPEILSVPASQIYGDILGKKYEELRENLPSETSPPIAESAAVTQSTVAANPLSQLSVYRLVDEFRIAVDQGLVREKEDLMDLLQKDGKTPDTARGYVRIFLREARLEAMGKKAFLNSTPAKAILKVLKTLVPGANQIHADQSPAEEKSEAAPPASDISPADSTKSSSPERQPVEAAAFHALAASLTESRDAIQHLTEQNGKMNSDIAELLKVVSDLSAQVKALSARIEIDQAALHASAAAHEEGRKAVRQLAVEQEQIASGMEQFLNVVGDLRTEVAALSAQTQTDQAALHASVAAHEEGRKAVRQLAVEQEQIASGMKQFPNVVTDLRTEFAALSAQMQRGHAAAALLLQGGTVLDGSVLQPVTSADVNAGTPSHETSAVEASGESAAMEPPLTEIKPAPDAIEQPQVTEPLPAEPNSFEASRDPDPASAEVIETGDNEQAVVEPAPDAIEQPQVTEPSPAEPNPAPRSARVPATSITLSPIGKQFWTPEKLREILDLREQKWNAERIAAYMSEKYHRVILKQHISNQIYRLNTGLVVAAPPARADGSIQVSGDGAEPASAPPTESEEPKSPAANAGEEIIETGDASLPSLPAAEEPATEMPAAEESPAEELAAEEPAAENTEPPRRDEAPSSPMGKMAEQTGQALTSRVNSPVSLDEWVKKLANDLATSPDGFASPGRADGTAAKREAVSADLRRIQKRSKKNPSELSWKHVEILSFYMKQNLVSVGGELVDTFWPLLQIMTHKSGKAPMAERTRLTQTLMAVAGFDETGTSIDATGIGKDPKIQELLRQKLVLEGTRLLDLPIGLFSPSRQGIPATPLGPRVGAPSRNAEAAHVEEEVIPQTAESMLKLTGEIAQLHGSHHSNSAADPKVISRRRSDYELIKKRLDEVKAACVQAQVSGDRNIATHQAVMNLLNNKFSHQEQPYNLAFLETADALVRTNPGMLATDAGKGIMMRGLSLSRPMIAAWRAKAEIIVTGWQRSMPSHTSAPVKPAAGPTPTSVRPGKSKGHASKKDLDC